VRGSSSRSAGNTSCPRPPLVVPGRDCAPLARQRGVGPRWRELRRRAAAHRLGAGAAAAKGVDARGSRRRRGSPAGQGRCSTGPARHRLRAHGTPVRHGVTSETCGLEPVRVVAPVVRLQPSDCGSLVDVIRWVSNAAGSAAWRSGVLRPQPPSVLSPRSAKLCGVDDGGVVAVEHRCPLGAHAHALGDSTRAMWTGCTRAIRRERPKRAPAALHVSVAASVAIP
jgi:hypothetical protein